MCEQCNRLYVTLYVTIDRHVCLHTINRVTHSPADKPFPKIISSDPFPLVPDDVAVAAALPEAEASHVE